MRSASLFRPLGLLSERTFRPRARSPASSWRLCHHVAGFQLEPVRDFICGATVVVLGPRSFSKTTPLQVTTKVLTPDDWYSAGYAINVRPAFLPLPPPAGTGCRAMIRK